MGFQGREFAFESPSAAVAGLIGRASGQSGARRVGRASEAVALTAARGRILAEPVHGDRDSPAFDHAAMDGYAVRADDVRMAAADARARGQATISLVVVGESRIGHQPPSLAAATAERTKRNAGASAVRIATGAPIPPGHAGMDAVVKREDTTEHPDSSTVGIGTITLGLDVARRVAPGDHVRRRGENARARDLLLSPGTLLTAASLGAVAAVGCVAPRVFTRLRVALISIGDELVDPGSTPGPYQIRDSNAAAIAAILRSQAWIDLVNAARLPDDADLASAMQEMTASGVGAEAVVLTGGVSMGHRDPVRAAVESAGAEVVFHGLPQRPGKPMLGAMLSTREGAAGPVFGLPGNPMSAMVTCTRIVLPVLAACAGAARTPAGLAPRLVVLAPDDGKRLDLWWHRPVRLAAGDDGTVRAEIVSTRGSGDIVSAARSDGFVELAPAQGSHEHVHAHGVFPFYPWPV